MEKKETRFISAIRMVWMWLLEHSRGVSAVLLATGAIGLVIACESGVFGGGTVKEATVISEYDHPVRGPEIYIDPEATAIGQVAENPFANRYVSYSGLVDVLTGAEDITQLINPPENPDDVYMQFAIVEGGETVYETGLIPAGMAANVVFAELFTAGEHHITVVMSPFLLYGDEYLMCPVNNAQELDITVEG